MRASLHRYNTRENGFTLVELLIVVLIIGILAAIAIPVYLGLQNQAKNNSNRQDVNSVVHSMQVALTEGQDLTTILTANTDNANRSDGTKVVSTTASDNKNYTVVGTQKDTNFTYTYDSKTGQFTEGTTDIVAGGGYVATGTYNGDGCDMEAPLCTANTGLQVDLRGRGDVSQSSSFTTANKHGGNQSWLTTATATSKVGAQLYMAAPVVGTTYRWDLYVLNGGTTFDAASAFNATNVSVTSTPNPDGSGWTLVQVTFTPTTSNPFVNVTTRNTVPSGTKVYWDDFKVYLP